MDLATAFAMIESLRIDVDKLMAAQGPLAAPPPPPQEPVAETPADAGVGGT